jgi:hypothetical protein
MREVSAASVGRFLARVAQHIPTAREISRQEEHQQHADDLHRLEAEQVHLGVARAGAGAEQHQQHGEPEAGQQRHEAQLAGEPLVVEPAEHRQQHRAGRRALGEIHEQQVVAHRIAQAHHEDQPDAAQRHQRRQKHLVALESAQAPEQMHQPERAEEDAAPQIEGALELRRLAHHHQRLQLAELLAGQQLLARDAADVGRLPVR